MTYRGHVCNGRIELENDVRLPEGAAVDVTLSERQAASKEDTDIPTLYEELRDVIGSVPGLPEDLSINHDHYLYGIPKRE